MSKAKSTSYFYAIFGIALVLLVVGIAAAIGMEAKNISNEFKEKLALEVVLKDNTSQSRATSLKTLIQGKKYIKSVKYISKEDAAEILKKNSEEKDFLEVLGYNPLYASFVVNLYKEYANADSVENVKNDLMKFSEVKQVNFQKNILESMDKSTGKAGWIIMIVAGALLIFAVSLIFNTIRLVMFSNRFTIKTMQLFGATRWFIIRPFLGRSIWNGFLSGWAACMILAGIIFYLDYSLPELGLKSDLATFAALFGVLMVFGILISFFSTLTAVLRYLRLKVEDLY